VLEAAKGRKARHGGKSRLAAADTGNLLNDGEGAPGLQAWLARRWRLVAAAAVALVLIVVSAVFSRLLW
jgi:hypothetical protein